MADFSVEYYKQVAREAGRLSNQNLALAAERAVQISALRRALEKSRAREQAFAEACRGLVEYRDANGAINFQLEKADHYIRLIRILLEEP